MTEPAVEISGLNKWFGPFQVLKDISLSVAPDERVIVCGPSGSGKSTLVRCLIPGPMKARGLSRAQATELARTYLARVRIAEQADKKSAQLSGGQQRRVAIARSPCMEPKIMLFDEPTSALDPEMISEVLDVMVELARDGMTMIVVTHEMGFARNVADAMVFMDAGEIVEQGPPGVFFDAPRTERCRSLLHKILSH